jgi:tetratricopeptide (TPR) repeat protein
MSASHQAPMLLIAVALLGGIVASGCDGSAARSAAYLKRGEAYLADGRLQKARVELQNALQIAPNDSEARLIMAKVAEQLGDAHEAYAMYQAALEANTENLQARASLARFLVFSGNADKALEVLARGLAQHPDDPDLITARGMARAMQHDTKGALADAERAARIAPGNEQTVLLLASLYRLQGDVAGAVQVLESTLRQRPRSVELRQVLAQLYAESGNEQRAEEQLRRLAEIRPRDLRPRYALADFYVRTQRSDDAERALQDAVNAAPGNDEPKLAYAEFLATQRSVQQGENTLARYIAGSPGKALNMRIALGNLQQRAGRKAAAIATYRAVVAEDSGGPEGISARNRIAMLDLLDGRLSEARQLVDEVLALAPRDGDALTLRGNIALESGDIAAAISDLRAVLRDQPGNVPVLRTLARAHLLDDESALAEENLRTAINASPADLAVQLELASLFMQTRRADQAVQLLEQSVRAHPTDVSVRQELVRAYLAGDDLTGARRAASDLETLAPNSAVGPYLAGIVARAQKRNADARTEFARALQLRPADMDTLTALARLEASQGRYQPAVDRARAALAAEPHDAAVHNLLGEALRAGGRSAEAIAEFSQASVLAPKWWTPYRNLAQTRLAANDVDGALAAYETGVTASQYDRNLVVELADLYEQRHRVNEAIRLYEETRLRQPNLQIAANNLAMLLVTYRQDRASLDRARDLTDGFVGSDKPALLDTYGWVRLKCGDLDAALPALERAAVQSPDSYVIHYHLGMVQFRVGQSERARANLETALAGARPFAGSDEARAVLAQLNSRAAGKGAESHG